MAFESIPGVGEKTADALAELDDPETALQQGDVLTLMDAPGISEGRAAAIARGAIRQRHDDPGGLLATERLASCTTRFSNSSRSVRSPPTQKSGWKRCIPQPNGHASRR